MNEFLGLPRVIPSGVEGSPAVREARSVGGGSLDFARDDTCTLKRGMTLFLLLLLILSPAAEARRRSVGFRNVPDGTTVPGWLSFYTYPLFATEHVPFSHDLEPLRHVIGDATVVGLGDATHGTHEFYTVKLRVIDYLVRNMGFDVIAFEAAVPHFDDLNAYVLGAPGDPRELLNWSSDSLAYHFWDVEEIVQVVEWMREYNAHRGDRPPVQIAGTDLFGQVDAYHNVLEYLRAVDPAMATEAEREYACIGQQHFSSACYEEAKRAHDALAAAEASLLARPSGEAYFTALLNARVVMQQQFHGLSPAGRDESMAGNLLFLAEHRSATGKVVYWGHNGHVNEAVMEFTSERPAGQILHETLGDAYFSIGTLTGGGTFLQWPLKANKLTRGIGTFPPVKAGAYETYLRQRPGATAYLMPLEGALPSWLTTPAILNTAGNTGAMAKQPMTLPALFDAVIYIETTTPLEPLRPLPE
jgi:erythromycin esterase